MSDRIYCYTGKTSRTLCKRVTTYREDGTENGFTTTPDGTETADVEMTIDVGELVRTLGDAALRSKSGRASARHGAIKLKVTNRQARP